jgi:hypothetical protein
VEEEELRKEGGERKELYRLPKSSGDGEEGEEGDGALHGFVWFVQEKVRGVFSLLLSFPPEN